jgi:hypothetical protein
MRSSKVRRVDSQSKTMAHSNPRAADPRGGHGDPAARQFSRRWVPIVAIAVTVIAIASAAYSLSRPSIPNEIEGLMYYEGLESAVADGPVEYAQTPPAGGAHAATSLECGIYFVPVEDEQAVATLATGAIWIAYDPDINERELEDLKIFGEGNEDVFMTPYEGLPHPAVVTAWGVQLYPDSPTDTRIASFIRDFKNADSAPYPDASCRRGEEVAK